MAEARRREEWDRFCLVVAALSFEKVNPSSLNPIRRAETERLKTKAFKRRETNSFFMALGIGLGDKGAVEEWQKKALEPEEAAARAEQSAPGKPSSN